MTIIGILYSDVYPIAWGNGGLAHMPLVKREVQALLKVINSY